MPGLNRDVDPHRAPGDAPAAPDAPRAIKLIEPGAEFVSEPMPIPAANSVPHRPGRGVAELMRETRFPLPCASRRGFAERRGIRHRRTEAGWTHHRAVPAREASLGQLIPLWALDRAGQ